MNVTYKYIASLVIFDFLRPWAALVDDVLFSCFWYSCSSTQFSLRANDSSLFTAKRWNAWPSLENGESSDSKERYSSMFWAADRKDRSVHIEQLGSSFFSSPHKRRLISPHLRFPKTICIRIQMLDGLRSLWTKRYSTFARLPTRRIAYAEHPNSHWKNSNKLRKEHSSSHNHFFISASFLSYVCQLVHLHSFSRDSYANAHKRNAHESVSHLVIPESKRQNNNLSLHWWRAYRDGWHEIRRPVWVCVCVRVSLHMR